MTSIAPSPAIVPDAEIEEKHRQLFSACFANDIDEIEELLRRGASVFATDESGCTALLDVADNKGNDAKAAEITQVLLDAGSNPNALTNYRTTPLHWSCFHSKVLMSTRLLEHGANPNIQVLQPVYYLAMSHNVAGLCLLSQVS